MPRSSCDVCCAPYELARSVDSYRAAELQILCNILDALSGGSGAPSANVNLEQVAGTSTAVNSGNANAGTQRVVIATDQAAIPVTSVSPSGTPTITTPTFANASSVTLLAANSSRKYLLIQNNSAANIMISLSGQALTGIVPTSSNKGIVLAPGDSYESPRAYITLSAITGYQTSGGSINTVVVVEG